MRVIVLLIIFLAIIFLDKGLTIANIKATHKYFPEDVKEDPYKIEKNPLAKFLFNKFGLWGGSLIYVPVTLVVMFLGFWLISLSFNERIAIYAIFLIHGVVIFNNIFMLLKHAKVI